MGDPAPLGPPAGVSPEIDPARLKVLALEARRRAEEDEANSGGTRTRLFAAFCFLECMANFDAGVLPATVSHVMTEFDLTFADGGALGAVVYLGLVLSSPIAGYFLTNLSSQKPPLIVAALANAVAVTGFALAPNPTTLFIFRTLIGFTQAPIIIYLPVWVDEFAPEGSAAIWMSALQASVAVGIMAGYVCAGVIVTYVGEETCPGVVSGSDEIDPTHGGHDGCYNPHWRTPLYIQAIGMGSFAPLFYLVAGRHLDCRGGEAGRILHAAKERLYIMLKLQSLPGPAMENALALPEVKLDLRRSSSVDPAQGGGAGGGGGGEASPRGVRAWRERTRREQAAVSGAMSPAPVPAGSEKGDSTQAVLGEMLLTETIGLVGLFAHHKDDEFGQQTGEGGGDGGVGEMSLGAQLSTMARNKLFLALTLSLSGLYFVVTGIQFWVTDYMTTPVAEGGVGIDAGLVVLSFSLSSLTGPTAGVFFGGWYIDKHGGYKDETGKAAAGTLKRCTVFGALALAFAIPAAFLSSFWPIQIAMWFVLFWGGALISPATGVCINAVSPELRAFSSALSMFSYNILGYSAAPYVCGLLAQQFSIRWGFRTVLLSSSIAFVGLTMAWRVAENEFTAREEFAGRASHKNPMRDSNLSSGSTSPDSPTPRHSPSIDNFGNDGSENNRTEALESNVDRTAKQDGAQSGRTSKLRLSMTWSGQSPRSRKSSDLEQSLTPRSRE